LNGAATVATTPQSPARNLRFRAFVKRSNIALAVNLCGEVAMAKSRRRTARKSRPKSVTVAALKRAVEGRHAQALADMYAEDAVMYVIDRDNPPSHPRRLKGRAAISGYFSDVCGRQMKHKIESGIATGNRLAFTQSCTYPDGTKVFCAAMLDLKSGKIAQQTVIQAWDG
jgi:hypothetical protein